MILTFIIALILSLVSKFFSVVISLIPDFNIPDFTVPQSMTNILQFVNYFLPMDTMFVAFHSVILLTLIRLTVAVLRFIKSFIPGISGGG